MVSDFIEGLPLSDLLQKQPLGFNKIASLVADTAEALSHAHLHGVIHRDIKPGNIMIESLPGDDEALLRPILVDFGLALRSDLDVVMTVDGQMIGTPAYMSPEQASGKGHQVDGRADIYCLGVVFYECLTGERPFRGTRAMVLHQVLHEDPRPPRRINDRIPRDLEVICLKAMAREPGWRYQTAAAFAADLRRFLRREPIQARPLGVLSKMARWISYNPALASMGVVAALAVLATCLALGSVAFQKSRALEDSERNLAFHHLRTALDHFNQGEIETGQLWLAKCIQTAPQSASGLIHVARANLCSWQPLTKKLISTFVRRDPNLAFAFNVDGSRLVFADDLGSVSQWDIVGDRRVGTPIKTGSPTMAVAIDKSGMLIATGGGDGVLRIWDSDTGQLQFGPLNHATPITVIHFVSGRDEIIIGCYDGSVTRWNYSKRMRLEHSKLCSSPVVNLCFSPDESLLLVSGNDKVAHLRSRDSTGNNDRHLPHNGSVSAAVFSDDGLMLATGALDRRARIWDCKKGELLGTFFHGAGITALSLEDRGSVLRTFGEDGRSRTWDVISGEERAVAIVHPEQVIGLGANGATLSVIGQNQVVRLRMRPDSTSSLVSLEHPVISVSIDPTGRYWMARTQRGFTGSGAIWTGSVESRKPLARLQFNNRPVASAFSSDGQTLLSGWEDGLVRFTSPDTGNATSSPQRQSNRIRAVAFDPKGQWWACATQNQVVLYPWTGNPKAARFYDISTANVLKFSPDGNQLAIGADSLVKLLTHLNSNETITLNHNNIVNGISYSQNGEWVGVTGGMQSTIWNTRTGGQSYTFDHADEVRTLCFSPNSQFVATCGKDKEARVWSMQTGFEVASMSHSATVTHMAFGPDSKTVATGCDDRTARIWDVVTALPIGQPMYHKGRVKALTFGAEGRLLLTACDDGILSFWSLPAVLDEPISRLLRRLHIETGLELVDTGNVRAISPDRWYELRRFLNKE
jgi:WD40 repeat protein